MQYKLRAEKPPMFPNGNNQAPSQKFVMGGSCFGGLGVEPPALENFAIFLQK